MQRGCGQIVKKRISVGGRGKSGGMRTIVAFKVEDKAFLYMVSLKINATTLTKKN